MSKSDGPLTFRALQLANEQRSTYGLRYNDFTRYRKHCANRTHRIRSALKTTHGRGKEFKKLPALKTETIRDGNLELLLFETERAWAFSQELSAQAFTDEAHAHTLRHTATSRFRRAVNHATSLLSHVQALHTAGRISATGLAEATAYTLLINGRFLRHRADYEDGLHQLCVARGLLDVLGSSARSTRDQALYSLFGDEAGPEIRYCAHELGSNKAYDVEGLVSHFGANHRQGLVDGYDTLIAKVQAEGQGAGEGRSEELVPLMWEDEPVPIRNPELVDVLLRVQRAQAKLKAGSGEKGQASVTSGKKGVAAYDAILLALSDAEEIAKKLAEAQKTSGSSTTPAIAGTRDLQYVHSFIVFQLLSRRIERDLLLTSALLSSQSAPTKKTAGASDGKGANDKGKSPAVDARLYPAVVKLLDTILQSLEQMRGLSIVDEEPDLAGAVDERVAYTRARRCLFLARSYAHVKKYAEALALHRSASLHVREARSAVSTLSSEDVETPASSSYPLPISELDALDTALESDALSFKAAWFTHNGGKATPEVPEGFKKPPFFDIALNYAELDMDALQRRAGISPAAPAKMATVLTKSAQAPAQKVAAKAVEERVQTPEPEPAQQKQGGGGLSSLLGGWWGRK